MPDSEIVEAASKQTAPKQKRGGRPSRDRAELIRNHILTSAAELFFSHGYGTTSIEAIAKHAGISKRTFYARFRDKADVLRAVVHHVVEQLRPAGASPFAAQAPCEEQLQRIAQIMVHAAVSPQALALQRLIVSEALRFPELAKVVNQQGARHEAITYISNLLKSENAAGRLHIDDAVFCAEQFMQMAVSLPQRRALGMGTPLTATERDDWAQKTVKLFLTGCRA
jgi:AcrR family transcriptional regulator